jgi:hypothetical protein
MTMQHTSEELNAFEQITFKNMVTFYREELQRVLNGEKTTHIFSKGDRRVLRRLGVLELRAHVSRNGNIKINITISRVLIKKLTKDHARA